MNWQGDGDRTFRISDLSCRVVSSWFVVIFFPPSIFYVETSTKYTRVFLDMMIVIVVVDVIVAKFKQIHLEPIYPSWHIKDSRWCVSRKILCYTICFIVIFTMTMSHKRSEGPRIFIAILFIGWTRDCQSCVPFSTTRVTFFVPWQRVLSILSP